MNLSHDSELGKINDQTPPRCQREVCALKRVPRGVLLKTVLFWLPVKKYSCYRCKQTVIRYK